MTGSSREAWDAARYVRGRAPEGWYRSPKFERIYRAVFELFPAAPRQLADHDLREQLQASLGPAYVIERELGAGGMARVFVAEEKSFGRRVVVKVLPPDSAGQISVGRFRREVQLAARLQHPHIVPLLNAGDSGGLLYYTMPFVTGETLRDRLARDGALAIPVAVRLLREVAQALAHAHRHGVVHRDIKPENVLLGEDGDALVADFGIAKALASATQAGSDTASGRLTGTGVSLGTPAYMAPEQALGDPATDHRADLYALGMIAYESLAGSTPFAGRSMQALIAAHATEVPEAVSRRRPHVTPELESLVMCLLEKNPADRPQSADDVVQALGALAAASSDRTHGGSPLATRERGGRRPRAVAGIAVLLLMAGIATYLTVHGTGTPPARRAFPIMSVPAAQHGVMRASVAVLPFANTSGDPNDEPFSDGLTDELIGALGKVGSLKVAGRTSSFALKGRGLDIRAVGDTLHVATVLEGSVRRSGNRLKVTAQLADAHDASVIWAEHYDRELKDVFAVQEEIARAIVGALRITLAKGPSAAMARAPTADLAAYDLFLRGRLYFNQRTERGLLRAVDFFEQAVARDPAYARAYAGLADSHVLLAIIANHDPREELPRARAAAAKALTLDSTLADAHATLGHVLFAFDWNWAQAGHELDRSIALDPSYSLALLWRGIYLSDQERFPEAERALRQALAIDPLSAPVSMNLGRILLESGQTDRAIAQLHDALTLDPMIPIAHTLLGYAYLKKGRFNDAVAAFRWAAERAGAGDSAQLAFGLAVAGRRPEAEAVLKAILSASHARYLSPVTMAIAYTGLGDHDAAFRWLERGVEEHGGYVEGLKASTPLAALHGDPRWVRLLRRIGLPPS